MKDIIVLILLVILYIAPSKSWSIGLIKVNSQFLSDHKLINLYLGILLITFLLILLLYRNRRSYKKENSFGWEKRTILFLYILSLIMCLLVHGLSYFGDEFIKFIAIIMTYLMIKRLLVNGKHDLLYKAIMLSIILLVLASFVSINYGGFQEQQRAGTIGFGINETAMLSSILLCHSLFKRDHSIFDVIFVIISIGAVAYTASRRGIIFAFICLFAFIISECFIFLWLNRRKKYNIESHNLSVGRAAFDILIIFILLVSISLVTEGKLINDVRLNDIPIMKRILDLEKRDALLYDVSRIYIYEDSRKFISSNILWGALGSDLYLADNVYYNNIHSHNIFIQFLARFGLIIFILLLMVILKKFCVMIKIIKRRSLIEKNKLRLLTLSIQGLIIFLIYEQLGYGLWQIKYLWVFLVFFFTINEKYFIRIPTKRGKLNDVVWHERV